MQVEGFRQSRNLEDVIPRFFQSKLVPWAAVGLGVALTLPCLVGGFAVDDHFHRIGVLGHPAIPGSPTSPFMFFSFAAGDVDQSLGIVGRIVGVWGMTEGYHISFMRPLSSVMHWVDYRLWPEQPWVMHLQNVFWYGTLILLLYHFYRRIMEPVWIAGLATLIYAVDDAHGMLVGWIANRNGLVTAVLGVLALTLFIRWRRDDWRPGAWLGPLVFAVALLAGESAIAVGAYLLAYVLFLEKGPWPRRFTTLLPFGLVVVIWRIVYSVYGFGVNGTGLYVDPAVEPIRFMKVVPERLPVILNAQLASPPADFWLVLTRGGQVMMSLWAIAVLLTLSFILKPMLRASAASRFFALGAALAAIPICATYPFDRLLAFVGIGAMGLVAQFLSSWKDRKGPARALFVVWFLIHVVFAPVFLPLRVNDTARMDAAMAHASESLPSDAALATQHLVVLNAPEVGSSFYAIIRRASLGEPLPAHTRFLSVSIDETRVERPDEQTLVISWPDGLYRRPLDRFFWSPGHPMREGDSFELAALDVEVLDVTEDGRPKAVRYRFAVPLEDEMLRWMSWTDGGYVPIEPPDVGETLTLPPLNLFDIYWRSD